MGNIVAVTGGGQGLGRAVALQFAQAGYAVSVADTIEDAGHEIVQRVQALGTKAMFMRTDVAEAGDVEAWMQATAATLGSPHVLINNAGISRNAPFLELKPADFDRVIAVNLRGAFLCAQAAAPRMDEGGRGGAVIKVATTRVFLSYTDVEAHHT